MEVSSEIVEHVEHAEHAEHVVHAEHVEHVEHIHIHETVTETHTIEVEVAKVNGHDNHNPEHPDQQSEDVDDETGSLQRSDSDDSLHQTSGMYELVHDRQTSDEPIDLAEKVVLIIGPLSAVGEAFTSALLRKNVKVIVMNVKEEPFEKFVQNHKRQFGNDSLVSIECNIFDDSSLEDGLKQAHKVFDQLDIIINTTSYVDTVNWRKVIDVNLTMAISLTELVLDHFGRDNGGSGLTLVQTSSFVGLYPNGSLPAYSASKAALIHYVKSYGRKDVYEMHGINMCVLCPAMVARSNEKSSSTLLDPQVAGRCLIDVLENNNNLYGAVIKITSEKPLYL